MPPFARSPRAFTCLKHLLAPSLSMGDMYRAVVRSVSLSLVAGGLWMERGDAGAAVDIQGWLWREPLPTALPMGVPC